MRAQFCTQCGHRLGPEERYCGQCGADVSAMTAVGDGDAPADAVPASNAGTQPAPSPAQRPEGTGLGYLLFSAEGRISRQPYWLCSIALFGINIAAEVMARNTYEDAWYLVYLLTIAPSIFLSIKRAHDRGRSGWFVLLSFVPLLNLWPAIELGFLRGTRGPNQYGPDPLARPVAEVASGL